MRAVKFHGPISDFSKSFNQNLALVQVNKNEVRKSWKLPSKYTFDAYDCTLTVMT